MLCTRAPFAARSVTCSSTSPGTPETGKPSSTQVQRLTAQNVTLGYEQRVIAENLSVEIPD
ncbi:ABC transporter ATP-binding protein, partial [Streptomyces sp. NPDC001193]